LHLSLLDFVNKPEPLLKAIRRLLGEEEANMIVLAVTGQMKIQRWTILDPNQLEMQNKRPVTLDPGTLSGEIPVWWS